MKTVVNMKGKKRWIEHIHILIALHKMWVVYQKSVLTSITYLENTSKIVIKGYVEESLFTNMHVCSVTVCLFNPYSLRKCTISIFRDKYGM